MDDELRTAAGIRREAVLWVPHQHLRTRPPDVHDLYLDVEDAIDCEVSDPTLVETDGHVHWTDQGDIVPVEVLIRRDPMFEDSPVLGRLTRERRRDAMTAATIEHLEAVDAILERGRGESSVMTWTRVLRYCGQALLLDPASTIPVTPRG